MYTRTSKLIVGYALLFLLHLSTVFAGQEETTGVTHDPLVTTTPPIDQSTQEEFKLLTLVTPLGQSCSASMLNDVWAITAAHCVFSIMPPCPRFQPNQITLKANWIRPTQEEKVKRIITYGMPKSCIQGNINTIGIPSDIALVEVRINSYFSGISYSMKLEDKRPQIYDIVTAFGQGVSRLAFDSSFQGGILHNPSFSDGKYRKAELTITSVGKQDTTTPPATYSFPGGRSVSTGGGDSGGPSFIQVWDSNRINRKLEWRLLGVHSGCDTVCLLSQEDCGITTNPSNPWTWVSSVKSCTDAAIIPVRDRILADIEVVDFEKSPSLAPPPPPTAEALIDPAFRSFKRHI